MIVLRDIAINGRLTKVLPFRSVQFRRLLIFGFRTMQIPIRPARSRGEACGFQEMESPSCISSTRTPLLQSVEMADERRKISEGVLQPDRDPSPQPPGPKGTKPLNPFTGKPMNVRAPQGIPGNRRTATEHG